MNPKTYLIRSIKYLVWLLLLITALFGLMLAGGASRADAGNSLIEMFTSHRGQLMLCVIVVLAAFYPKFGFTRRQVEADLWQHRELIIHVFSLCGYALHHEEGTVLTFRASSPFKRLLLLREDPITVTASDGKIELNGIRKEVVRIQFRLNSQLHV